MQNFFCLMFSGIPFHQQISNALIDLARYMYQEQKEKFAFKTSTYAGELRTKFQAQFISSRVGGVHFEADLECEEGKTLVKFLVPKAFLDSDLPSDWEGEWVGYDPDHPSNYAHLN